MLELPSISHRVESWLSSLDKRKDSLNSKRVLGFIKILCKFYEKKRKVNGEILLKGDLHKEVGPMLFLFFLRTGEMTRRTPIKIR